MQVMGSCMGQMCELPHIKCLGSALRSGVKKSVGSFTIAIASRKGRIATHIDSRLYLYPSGFSDFLGIFSSLAFILVRVPSGLATPLTSLASPHHVRSCLFLGHCTVDIAL